MSLKDTAKYLGVSINTFKKLMSLKKDIPVARLSKRLFRINRKALDTWLIMNSTGGVETKGIALLDISNDDAISSMIEEDIKETVQQEGAEHYE